jgi:glycosyltransferase involved in cell wall biosynthesis
VSVAPETRDEHAGAPQAPDVLRLRLLYVVGNFVAGGAERHLLEMWKRIDRERFDVHIAYFRLEGQFVPDVRALGLPLHDLRMGRRIYDLRGIRALGRLVSLTRRLHPDVIHGYLFGPNLFAAIAGRLAGVPVVAIAKRNIDAFESPRQIAVQRVAHRLATHVTAVSAMVGETSVALGAPRSRVTVIENGVDVARFDGARADRALLGVTDARPIVGSVGCLAARKDYGTLLDALARLTAGGRDVVVTLVGDGPDRTALEAQARSLGLEDRVRFLGERPDVDRLLPAMDLFVLSSREEGIPNALLEAMAAGRPSIVTDVGGNREVLDDGDTGWIVPARDPAALARALGEALDDPAEARRRGERARQVTRERRSIDVMVRRHEAFYRAAVAQGRTRR